MERKGEEETERAVLVCLGGLPTYSPAGVRPCPWPTAAPPPSLLGEEVLRLSGCPRLPVSPIGGSVGWGCWCGSSLPLQSPKFVFFKLFKLPPIVRNTFYITAWYTYKHVYIELNQKFHKTVQILCIMYLVSILFHSSFG